MDNYNFFVPTNLKFGANRINEVGKTVSNFGERCLLVTSGNHQPLKMIYDKTKSLLKDSGVEVFHFDGVVPNPTVNSVNNAMAHAQANNIDCVLGLGGGSALDTAKLVALTYATKGEIDWEFVFKEYTDPFKNYMAFPESLPLIVVTTTSGTGSHLTQAAVVTDEATEEKLTIFHPNNFPLMSIVDPEIMLSMPAKGTAATGFDVFAHAFESFLGNRVSPLTESTSLQAIKLVVENLPKLLKDPENIELRSKLAWADTMAGLSLANGGADIPHPLSEIIGGICPRIAHGECLALVYPEFLAYKVEKAEKKFATIARHLNNQLANTSDKEAAAAFCSVITNLLKQINLWASLKDYKVTEEEYAKIINNPILGYLPFATKTDLVKMLIASYERI